MAVSWMAVPLSTTISPHRYDKNYVKVIDLWVHFATKVANVECFTLGFRYESHPKYELPQFAYKNKSMRSLILINCELNPSGIIWLPNLESLELHNVLSILRLEISSLKLTYLSIKDNQNENHDLCLEILAPHIKYLQLLGYCDKIRLNVASLTSAILSMTFDDLEDLEDEDRNSEEECSYLKELLRSVAHVENLELGPWCIECLSILGLNGWQSPPSSRKFLKFDTALEQSDFPGICSFLQSSPDLETLTIDWYNHRPRFAAVTSPSQSPRFSGSLEFQVSVLQNPAFSSGSSSASLASEHNPLRMLQSILPMRGEEPLWSLFNTTGREVVDIENNVFS
ncbi:hypothetical protein RND71_042579 [Anisodus tanguticus]|uniref:Uncharacterized protein n=1 Tax=Anisodus tanguticus TaxID=243964 RepID=A0AAE1UP96_9SOLA|nr:hypothetical protein RND71_042579 [Anisodus tanguticus]